MKIHMGDVLVLVAAAFVAAGWLCAIRARGVRPRVQG